MKYFLLKDDPKFSDGPVMGNIPIDKNLVCRELVHKIPKRQSARITTSEYTIFPDLITRPVILISEMMMLVIQMYGDMVLKRDMVLIDSERQIVKRYFVIVLDCLNVSAIHSKADGSRSIGVMRRGRPLDERNIFEIEFNGKKEIVVNLDFAESMLRRGGFGITLEEITINEVEDAEE